MPLACACKKYFHFEPLPLQKKRYQRDVSIEFVNSTIIKAGIIIIAAATAVAA